MLSRMLKAAMTLAVLLALTPASALARGGGGGGGATTPPAGATPCATVEVNNPLVSVNSKASVTPTWKVSSCSTADETVHGVLTGTCLLSDGTRSPTVTQTGPALALRPRDSKSFSLQLASNVNCPTTVFDYVMTIYDDASGAALASAPLAVRIIPGF
jgi:hypothetical protein